VTRGRLALAAAAGPESASLPARRGVAGGASAFRLETGAGRDRESPPRLDADQRPVSTLFARQPPALALPVALVLTAGGGKVEVRHVAGIARHAIAPDPACAVRRRKPTRPASRMAHPSIRRPPHRAVHAYAPPFALLLASRWRPGAPRNLPVAQASDWDRARRGDVSLPTHASCSPFEAWLGAQRGRVVREGRRPARRAEAGLTIGRPARARARLAEVLARRRQPSGAAAP
jgi:hypothetical protein